MTINEELVKVEEYILLPKEIRQSHLKLDEACFTPGIKRSSQNCIALLCWALKTTAPINGKKIHLCHACHNAECANPNHLYWGTASENSQDSVSDGNVPFGGKRVKSHTEETKLKISNALKSQPSRFHSNETKNKISEALKTKSIENTDWDEVKYRIDSLANIDISKRGWVNKVSQLWGISHSQVKRFIEKHYDGRYGDYYTRKAPSK